jgi:hypothetical protein
MGILETTMKCEFLRKALIPVALLGLALAQTAGAQSPQFPLQVSSQGRYLEDQSGNAFLLNGEAAWSLIVQLNKAEVDQYLLDRQQKGFNAIYVNLIEHRFSFQNPAWENNAGDSPFSGQLAGGELDFTTPNEAYWAHVDYVLQKAESLGILVIAFPSYIGYQFNSAGWAEEMAANGTARLRSYGQWLGTRYSSQENIIWAMGGDWAPSFNSQDLSAEVTAIANGLASTDTNALITAHSSRQRSATDDYNFPWLDIDTTYSDCTASPQELKNSFQSGALPFFFIEGRYENSPATPRTTLTCIRSQAYWSILGGAFGHFYGNSPIWSFEAAGNVSLTWQEGLDQPGAFDMSHVGELMRSRPFELLVPDYAHQVLTGGFGNIAAASYAAVARASDGSFMAAYIPTSRTVTVNMGSIAGSSANAWWFDPRNGNATSIGSFANSGNRSFTSPSNADWVLVIDNSDRNFPPPGASRPKPPTNLTAE